MKIKPPCRYRSIKLAYHSFLRKLCIYKCFGVYFVKHNEILQDICLKLSLCQYLYTNTIDFLNIIEDFIFLSNLRFTVKLRENTEISHLPLPHTCIASFIINTTHQNGAFFTKGEPTLTHYGAHTYLQVH